MNLMIFEKLIESKDRKKIRKRTRDYREAYDYRLSFAPALDKAALSFLVVGDSGAGGLDKPMKYHVADEMKKETGIDLVLHVGDMVYLSGAKQGYPLRFIKTYRHWLLRGEAHNYKDMIFNKPFLPIYGNHDYYDFRKALPGIGHLVGIFSKSIGSGSKNGKVFEKAFVETDNTRLQNGKLEYKPNEHTKIPNRYYWYTAGPCAFFALDSNTLDTVREPSAKQVKILETELGKIKGQIKKGRKGVKHFQSLAEEGKLTESLEKSYEIFFDELIELEKKAALLKKRLDANRKDHDSEQLKWLDRVLKHEDATDKWKIIYLHHSLYSSEAGHTDDAATGGLRDNLRKIFTDNKVNLVLSGHSHCFEWPVRLPAQPYMNQAAKDLADREHNICYIVTGGGGQGLRESILEQSGESEKNKQDLFLSVAESRAYTAGFKEGQIKGNYNEVHNFVRIEADEKSLKVIPVGVAEKGGAGERLTDFYTKVFPSEDQPQEMEIKKLKAIQVFKEKAPEAEWVEKS